MPDFHLSVGLSSSKFLTCNHLLQPDPSMQTQLETLPGEKLLPMGTQNQSRSTERSSPSSSSPSGDKCADWGTPDLCQVISTHNRHCHQ